ncbi:MAG: ferrous iron transport protein A [Lachnospiraceae bacterium]|nr:ferrous iron transport protein A [Lachnospiraceae bacterium]
MKLCDAKAGSSGTITFIEGDTRFLSRITSMGLTEGCKIVIMKNEKSQPLLLLGRDSLIAVNRKDCERIEVKEA